MERAQRSSPLTSPRMRWAQCSVPCLGANTHLGLKEDLIFVIDVLSPVEVFGLGVMFALPVKPPEIELILSVTAPSLIIVFNFETINSVCNYFFMCHSF